MGLLGSGDDEAEQETKLMQKEYDDQQESNEQQLHKLDSQEMANLHAQGGAQYINPEDNISG